MADGGVRPRQGFGHGDARSDTQADAETAAGSGMDKIRIEGGQPLDGTITISGAKNACLTLMPAALLTDAPLTLTNAPRLSDI